MCPAIWAWRRMAEHALEIKDRNIVDDISDISDSDDEHDQDSGVLSSLRQQVSISGICFSSYAALLASYPK